MNYTTEHSKYTFKYKNRRQNIINFYLLGIYLQKWMQMGFIPMSTPTRDAL